MKRLLFTCAVLMICVIGTLTTQCKKKQKNVVTDYPAITDALYDGFPLNEFKASNSEGKQKLIDDYRQILVENVRNHLGKCIRPQDITFVFGSGSAKKVENATGKPASGTFTDELVVIVKSKCKTGAWFLACGNGMLINALNFTSQHSYGDGCEIVIKSGESLATYWPMLQKWSANAQEMSVPIRNTSGNIVSAKIYKHVLGDYESVLFPGDKLNVCTGKVYNKLGQEVDFNSRLKETKKANKAIADSLAKKAKASQKQLKKKAHRK